MISLKNKNIIVTGASGGIGTSLSKAFSATNANLFLLGSSNEKLSMLREELPLAEAVEVKVTKFQPPIGGDCDHIAVVMQG